MNGNIFDESGKIISGTLKFRRDDGTLEREEKYVSGQLKCKRSFALDGQTLDGYIDENGDGFETIYSASNRLVRDIKNNCCIHETTYRRDNTKEKEIFYEGRDTREVGYLSDGETVDYELFLRGVFKDPWSGTKTERENGFLTRKNYEEGICIKTEGFLKDEQTLDWMYERNNNDKIFKGNEKIRGKDGTLKTEYIYGTTFTKEQTGALKEEYKKPCYWFIEKSYWEDGKTLKYIARCTWRGKGEKKAFRHDGWQYELDKQGHVISARHFKDGVEDTKSFGRKLSLLKKIAKVRVDSEKDGEILPTIEKKNTTNLALAYLKAKTKKMIDK